jgi:hypothetical protein
MQRLRKCPIELPTDEECDATDDDSSNAAGLITLRPFVKLKASLHRIYIRHNGYASETFVLMKDGYLLQ